MNPEDLVGKKLTGFKEYVGGIELFFDGSILDISITADDASECSESCDAELFVLVKTPESIKSINQRLSPSDERELEQHRAWDDE